MAQSQRPAPPANPDAELAAWNKSMAVNGDLPSFNRPFFNETPEQTAARLEMREALTASTVGETPEETAARLAAVAVP